MKRLLMAIVLLLSLFTVPALAVDEPYTFTTVEYNDRELASTDIVEVVAGESVSFETYLLGNEDTEDVKVRAYITGYEYDDIEDKTGAFDVNTGVTYKNVMTLDIPNDMEAGNYQVVFEAYDKDYETEVTVVLNVIILEHELEFQDVDADSTVDAGEELEVYVRLENTGESKEEDIRVTVSIPELGVSERGYVNELVADEDAEGMYDDDEETSGAITLALGVPAEAPSGEYDVEVEVSYEDGYSTNVEVFTVTVDGVEAESDAESDADADASTVVVVVSEDDTDADADADATVDANDAAEPVDSITVSTNALKIGFGVLAALLVIIAIVFILRRE